MRAGHVRGGADITGGCVEVPLEQASAVGVMAVDDGGEIIEFMEKPDKPPALPGQPGRALASMGIYVFNTATLVEELTRDASTTGSTRDFGSDIIPGNIKRRKVQAFPFRDHNRGTSAYWRDVGTVDSFWASNLELIGISPELNLYDLRWPIWTYQDQVPPAKFIFDDAGRRGMAVDSMVAGGSIVSGSSVRHSLLFSNVRIHSYSRIEDAVIFPHVEVGRNCHIRKAVIDSRSVIPPDTRIGLDPVKDAQRFYVSEGGVVLVTPDMLGQNVHYGP